MTTMQMTRAVAKSEGYSVILAEYRVAGKHKHRKDLGGFGDYIMCRQDDHALGGDLLAVQHTVGLNNRGEHIRKIQKLANAKAWLNTGKGRIEVWAWRELKDGWHLQRTELTLRFGSEVMIKDRIVSDSRYDY